MLTEGKVISCQSSVFSKPLCIDLFCGLGGWAEGFLAEGFTVVGFDIVRMAYPGFLVLQDVRHLHGSQFRRAACLVASPPCTEPSYAAMPWKRAKAKIPPVLPLWWKKSQSQMSLAELAEWEAWKRENPAPPPKLFLELFETCFRLQREACEAAEHYIPMVVENVCGAQKWVGRARWHFGSYYLWGDVPALMPDAKRLKKSPFSCSNLRFFEREASHWGDKGTLEHIKNNGGSWFAVAHNTESGKGQNPDGRKITGQNWNRHKITGETSPHWRLEGFKIQNHINKRDGAQSTKDLTNPAEHEGIKQHGSCEVWFDQGIAALPSRGNSRKAVSALIAKIPFPLARHIARCFKPTKIGCENVGEPPER